jgi:hypothetical protein
LAVVQLFLTTPILRHATLALRDTILPATVDFFRDSQLAWILPFGF